MQTYEYRGFDTSGRRRRGLVEAVSPKEARECLSAEGILAERLTATGRQVRFPPVVRATVYHELGALLGAGMTLMKAFDLLIQSVELGDVRGLLAGVRDRIRNGASLSDAMAAGSRWVTPYEMAALRAAEQSGSQAAMLGRLAAYLEERDRLRQRALSAMIYPALILVAGIAVAVLQLGFLLPRTRELVAAGGGALPGVTRFMLGVGQVVTAAGLPALCAVLAAVVFVRWRLARDPVWRARWDRGLFRLPLIGRARTLLVNARFARTMGILLHGGASAMESLRLAGHATGSPWLAAQAEAAAESVRQGTSVSDAIRRIGPLGETLCGWIEVGENTGDLQGMLGAASDRCQERWERFLQRALALLEPALLLAIGAFVMVVTLAVLLPVFSLTRSIGM
jgi:general secretion pathway protein F